MASSLTGGSGSGSGTTTDTDGDVTNTGYTAAINLVLDNLTIPCPGDLQVYEGTDSLTAKDVTVPSCANVLFISSGIIKLGPNFIVESGAHFTAQVTAVTPPPPLPAGEQVSFYHTDPAGTALAMTDKDKNVIWKASYQPFGDAWQVDNPSDDDKMFIGKPMDIVTNMQVVGVRPSPERSGAVYFAGSCRRG